jgi:NAD(P)H-hydrate epimerase
MRPVLTAQEMAALDRYSARSLGLSGHILMACAARECLRVLRERWPATRRVLVLAGPGNNGGDGVALAYYAQAAGLSPTLLLCQPDGDAVAPYVPPGFEDVPALPWDGVTERRRPNPQGALLGDVPAEQAPALRLSRSSAYFLGICERAFIPTLRLPEPARLADELEQCGAELVVDALFGTGLDRPLAPYYAELIGRLNAAGLPVLAVDCPSGLDCTTGNLHGAAVRADCTVTLGYPKRGFFHPRALALCGEVVSADIGFAPLADASIEPSSHAWADALWPSLVEPRRLHSHKGLQGRLLVVAGHARYPGAPRLSSLAALRAGAGLVRLVVPQSIHAVCSSHPSVMCTAHPQDADGGFAAEPSGELREALEWCDALALGPGLGGDGPAQELARTLLDLCERPVVLDADGLRVLHHADAPVKRWPLVLTPHLGELAQLAGVKEPALEALLFGLSVSQAQRHNALVLAKSVQCALAAPSGALLFPHAGLPALAVGGTGDVLTGMVGALLARWHARDHAPGALDPQQVSTLPALRELTAAEIVCTAVNWHAAAGRRWTARHGENGLTALDLIDELPDALEEMKAQGARREAQG